MEKQGQTDVSVRDKQTKMELPVVALLGEAVGSRLQDSVCFPGFCRWEQGWRSSCNCARMESGVHKWTPSDLFHPVIRPADSPLPVSASDNFLILKEFPNSGALCRHLKIGLMEAIRLYIH